MDLILLFSWQEQHRGLDHNSTTATVNIIRHVSNVNFTQVLTLEPKERFYGVRIQTNCDYMQTSENGNYAIT